ncbi:endonuclease YncB(thermonuclease family) [Nocardioides marinisabuli]|uniref:Endonuclease YncB(Thermonuclease family) n=1 Tax=Nocardioides marinisabuli TaxID=419476 RepID=A0A7Y9JQA3_9ACTN|nr:hypothetical protein [Nocardioides marinisabuli]NYD56423.1 endonuclease YncB(thermonuclease family) [Nocardioides marinisabuli]
MKLFADTTQDLKDKYDRILRYVQRIKGRKDRGKLQLKAGLAKVCRHGLPPGTVSQVDRHRIELEAGVHHSRYVHYRPKKRRTEPCGRTDTQNSRSPHGRC